MVTRQMLASVEEEGHLEQTEARKRRANKGWEKEHRG